MAARIVVNGLIVVSIIVGLIEFIGIPKSGYMCYDFRTERTLGYVDEQKATAWISPFSGTVRAYKYKDHNELNQSVRPGDGPMVVCEFPAPAAPIVPTKSLNN